MINRKSIWVLIWLLGGLLFASDWVYAQDVQVKRSEKIVNIGSKQFYMHHVKAGETVYAIAKVYHVTENDILSFNPDVRLNGLQAGMVIGVPVVEEDRSQEKESVVQEVTKPVEII